MTTATVSTPVSPGIGGRLQTYHWIWQGQTFAIAYETLGQGSPVLLLPAFSTVSSRGEMRGLAQPLAEQFQVFALDWPGFGDSSRPPVNYHPALYHQFLQDFVGAMFDQPVALVAAGHAAGYGIQLGQQQPLVWSRMVLIAPTWLGPLRAMGANPILANTVRGLVRSPLLGQALYHLNTAPSFLRWMYRRHVYVDPEKLTPDFIAQKHRITQQPGARYAPAAFVTGHLDPLESRAEFLAQVQALSIPILVIIAEQAPPKSKAEMEALAALPEIAVSRLPGTLGLHEELAPTVAATVLPFLTQS